MSNLKKQVAAIKQQLAVGTAETVARFQKVETDLQYGIKSLQEQMSRGFQELRQAIEDNSMVQQSALDKMLDMMVSDQEDVQSQLAELRQRLARLEQDRPPAA